MNEYKAKITIDAQQATASAQDAARAVGGVTSATNAVSAVLQGDFVAAVSQAKTSFVAFRSVFAATPWGAAVIAIGAVATALIGAAWRRNAEEIAELRQETENYITRLKELRGELDNIPQRTVKNLRVINKAESQDDAERLGKQARDRAAQLERQASEQDKQAGVFQKNLGRGARQADVEKAQNEAARLRVLAEEYRQAAGDYEEAAKRIADARAKTSEAASEDAKREADNAASLAKSEQDRIAQAERNLSEAERRTKLSQKTTGASPAEAIKARLMDAQERYAEANKRQFAPGVDRVESLNAAAEQEGIMQEMIQLRQALKELTEEEKKTKNEPDKPDKPDAPVRPSIPSEGFESFMQASAGNFGSTIGKSDTERAKGFRSSLNKSAIESLGRDFGEKGSADSKLEELQRESRDYLKAIYETWKPWNLTGAGE